MRDDVNAQSPIKSERLKIRKPKRVAAGITGVTKSFGIGLSEAGLGRTLRTMRSVNRFDGYDCPGAHGLILMVIVQVLNSVKMVPKHLQLRQQRNA